MIVNMSAIVKTGIRVNIVKPIGTIVGQIPVTMEQLALTKSRILIVLVLQDLEVNHYFIGISSNEFEKSFLVLTVYNIHVKILVI